MCLVRPKEVSLHLKSCLLKLSTCLLIYINSGVVPDLDPSESLNRIFSNFKKRYCFSLSAIQWEQGEPAVLHSVMLHVPREPCGQDMDHKGG